MEGNVKGVICRFCKDELKMENVCGLLIKTTAKTGKHKGKLVYHAECKCRGKFNYPADKFNKRFNPWR